MKRIEYTIYKKRELIKKLRKKGYELDRYSGSHQIYKNDDGNVISVPKSVNPMICRRLIKENNL